MLPTMYEILNTCWHYQVQRLIVFDKAETHESWDSAIQVRKVSLLYCLCFRLTDKEYHTSRRICGDRRVLNADIMGFFFFGAHV